MKEDMRKEYNMYVNNLVDYMSTNLVTFNGTLIARKKDIQGILPWKKRHGIRVTETEVDQAEQLRSH